MTLPVVEPHEVMLANMPDQATLAAEVGEQHDFEEALKTGVTSSFAIATAAAIRCVWFEVKGGERWLHIDSHEEYIMPESLAHKQWPGNWPRLHTDGDKYRREWRTKYNA